MIGMIKKDLFMFKNNFKSIIVALVIYVLYTVMFDMDMSFILPFMTLMICISTFSYDDFNNWHSFATALPQGKVNVVKSKYITTIGIIVISTVISIVLSFIMSNIRGTLKIDESISTIMGQLLAIIFMMAALFPILFKYGSEKGRVAMLIFSLGILGGIVLVTKFIKIEISQSLIAFFDSYFIVIFIVVSIIIISVSYLISKNIYLKREF